jgi:hypothetical protein
MKLSNTCFRAFIVATGLAYGLATQASAVSVVYSYEGSATQKWTDPDTNETATNSYYVVWTAIFPDFVTSETFESYDSCSVLPDTFTGFAVDEDCYVGVNLVPGPFDTAWFSYVYPEFSHSGDYAIQFEAGAFSKAGTYLAEIGGVVTSGELNVYATPGAPTSPTPVPLPAGLPILAGALGALGLFGRLGRRRRATTD